MAALQCQESAIDQQIRILGRVLERSLGQTEGLVKAVLIDRANRSSAWRGAGIGRIGLHRASPRRSRPVAAGHLPSACWASRICSELSNAVERGRALQIVQVVGAAAKNSNEPDRRFPKSAACSAAPTRSGARAGRAAGQPSPWQQQRPASLSRSIRDAFPRIEQQRCDAAVAQLPDRAIENEVVNVNQRREDQKAGREVMMKRAAGQPRSGNEQRNAADNQHAEIRQRTPVARSLAASPAASRRA